MSFSGKIEFGVINQSVSAFNHILGGDFSLIVYQFQAISAFSAVIDRLVEFDDVLDSSSSKMSFPAPWKRFLLHTVKSEVHFYWASNGSILMDRCHKAHTSSEVPALKVNTADDTAEELEGPINRNDRGIIFLPQRPYKVLEDFRLWLHIITFVGRLDSTHEWSSVLVPLVSKDRRLAFCTSVAFQNQKGFLLDEATSAFDEANEEHLVHARLKQRVWSHSRYCFKNQLAREPPDRPDTATAFDHVGYNEVCFSRRRGEETYLGKTVQALENFCLIHVSLVPVLNVVGEQTTKHTQHSVRGLRGLGLTPNLSVFVAAQSVAREPDLQEWTARTRVYDILHEPILTSLLIEELLCYASCPLAGGKLVVEWVAAGDLEDVTATEAPDVYKNELGDLLKPLGLHDANSTEFDPETSHALCHFYARGFKNLHGGNYASGVQGGLISKFRIANQQSCTAMASFMLMERHRHRYEVTFPIGQICESNFCMKKKEMKQVGRMEVSFSESMASNVFPRSLNLTIGVRWTYSSSKGAVLDAVLQKYGFEELSIVFGFSL
ncbi:hypothetical protein NC651_025994 [Populus alba x Populus x berolinensis]|nr:hypothetical protein NC651_025994 [Populus alba x Populus x berolinensis]